MPDLIVESFDLRASERCLCFWGTPWEGKGMVEGGCYVGIAAQRANLSVLVGVGRSVCISSLGGCKQARKCFLFVEEEGEEKEEDTT